MNSIAATAQPDAALPIIIVTGMSGSGKSTALAVFEDMGFFTVDGLPVAFLPQLVTLVQADEKHRYAGMAVGMDLRQKGFTQEYQKAVSSLHAAGVTPYVLFFEARPDILIKRYATTRRPHPLEKEGLGLEQALEKERTLLRPVRALADVILDTSAHSVHDLRRSLQKQWLSRQNDPVKALRVHLVSFGFKYGTPAEADMVFDLRFLPNPYFEPELRPLSGCDAPIANYVLSGSPGKEFFPRLLDFVSYLLAQYDSEGRYRVAIALGCTGGRHRSVAVTEALAKALQPLGYPLSVEHKHLELG